MATVAERLALQISGGPQRWKAMYSFLEIDGFRLFEHFKLENLCRVNLFLGPNNSGKTSFLESVFAHACGLNFVPFIRNVLLRRHDFGFADYSDMDCVAISLFSHMDSHPFQFRISAGLVGDDTGKHELVVSFYPASLQRPGKWNISIDGEECSFDFVFPPTGIPAQTPFKIGFMPGTLEHRRLASDIWVFWCLEAYGMLEEFVRAMQSVFPRLTNIDMVPYPDGSSGEVYVEMGDKIRMPLHAFGDGMRRCYFLLGNMLILKNATHCIEEIDSMLHPSSYAAFSRMLVEYAETNNNQLFLTSNSIEFVDTFLESLHGDGGLLAGGEKDPVRIFRIVPAEGGAIGIWPLTGREAYKKRKDYALEL